ncbi:hypothetical protein HBHAL_1764 [Halobacillus halophilus DSM 2266]|uniref:Uncharacterized protein n=1 Tax=Halobacillus halophilus (strain ATCC 35676 / DSM 2266 / JCM 20832 / KCTC 3685 / LMG 17431 / NBRC 102448 / NCIMB 2269) TaxID=866895 RepID=I0JJ11_HALH3|nr:hypothetical protein HBHAL_1764 [Halobacillus halophilus DSM 2266]
MVGHGGTPRLKAEAPWSAAYGLGENDGDNGAYLGVINNENSQRKNKKMLSF